MKRLLEFGNIDDIHKWIIEIFTQLIEKVSERNNKNQLQVEKIIDFITDNYDKDVGLKDLAKVVFLTPNYIGSISKDHTGRKLRRLFDQGAEVEKAKELLTLANNRISEVLLYAVGYSNIAYFCTKFKNVYRVVANRVQGIHIKARLIT